MIGLALSLVIALVAVAGAEVPLPTLEGPISSPDGAFLQGTNFDLGQVGYEQQEYFISGMASAYTNTAPLGTDGRWNVAAGESTPYKTRIVVRRPIAPERFRGTVLVEWLNVSGGLDASPDWVFMHTELIRRGYAWVGVSAQYVGVEGGPGLVSVISLPLKAVNPARYGSLHHPGDSFSYDMFSQAGRAVRQPGGALGELDLKHVIAVGESQSAFRMVTYIDAIHPLTRLFDGYFVHSRAGILGAALSEAPQVPIPVPGTALIRTDTDVPVVVFETESDLTFLGYYGARQDDDAHFRLWEVAGTAHADTYTVAQGPGDLGNDPAVVGLFVSASPVPGLIDCTVPINSGPQHFVLKAAIAALDRWVRTGRPPKSAPRLDVAAGPPVTINRDAHGNALGGIRTPQVDIPIAAFGGEQNGSLLCRLFGSTAPFDDATLASLYPDHLAFRSAYIKALQRSVRARWILPADAKLMRKWAAGSTVGE